MRRTVKIQCPVDKNNYLQVSPNGSGDVAVQTMRFNPKDDNDYCFPMTHATLRTGMGGGRAATLSKHYRTVDDLHHQFLKLKAGVLREGLHFPIANDDYNIQSTTVNIITIPSDDGALANRMNILNANDVIGIQTSEGRKEEAELSVPVWLGSQNGTSAEAKLLKELWQSAKETCAYYRDNSSYEGFEISKKEYSALRS